MSEHAPITDPQTKELFRPEEIREFDAEDAEAGRAIGKMLSLFFVYTVIVMALSTWFTYYWVTTSTVR